MINDSLLMMKMICAYWDIYGKYTNIYTFSQAYHERILSSRYSAQCNGFNLLEIFSREYILYVFIRLSRALYPNKATVIYGFIWINTVLESISCSILCT